jgi:ATP adenylyltransferase
MERLFAPWRMTYISADTADGGGSAISIGTPKCIFCDKVASQDDQANLIVHRGTTAFVLLNLYPYNNGHLMVAPYLHTARLTDLDGEALGEIMELIKHCEAALDHAYKPQGYNIGMNLGQIAGAGIADHLHMHIVPRWSGDTNFMPVLGDTKVLPDSLQGSYEKIVLAWIAIRSAPSASVEDTLKQDSPTIAINS